MAGHLGDDMGDQSAEGLAQQMFQAAPSVLHFVEGALHAFPQTVEPRLETRRPGYPLVGSAGGEEVQVPRGPLPLLPVFSNEPFIPEHSGLPETVQDLIAGATATGSCWWLHLSLGAPTGGSHFLETVAGQAHTELDLKLRTEGGG